MPQCWWASTTPGKTRKPRASTTSAAASAGISGASRANLPPETAMSSAATSLASGRTTRAFFTSRSKSGTGTSWPFGGSAVRAGRQAGQRPEQLGHVRQAVKPRHPVLDLLRRRGVQPAADVAAELDGELLVGQRAVRAAPVGEDLLDQLPAVPGQHPEHGRELVGEDLGAPG